MLSGLCGGNFVLRSETINGLRNKFIKWKEAFESMGLKVNFWITKVMISRGQYKRWLVKKES